MPRRISKSIRSAVQRADKLPPLCTVAKLVSPEGMCGESYEISQAKKQVDLRLRGGSIPSKRSKVCTPVSGGLPGLLTCVECSPSGDCKETLNRIRSDGATCK